MNGIIPFNTLYHLGGFVEITMPKESSWSPDVSAQLLLKVIS